MMVGHFLIFIQSRDWPGGRYPVLKRGTLGSLATPGLRCRGRAYGSVLPSGGSPRRGGLFRRFHAPPPVVGAGRGARPGEPLDAVREN